MLAIRIFLGIREESRNEHPGPGSQTRYCSISETKPDSDPRDAIHYEKLLTSRSTNRPRRARPRPRVRETLAHGGPPQCVARAEWTRMLGRTQAGRTHARADASRADASGADASRADASGADASRADASGADAPIGAPAPQSLTCVRRRSRETAQRTACPSAHRPQPGRRSRETAQRTACPSAHRPQPRRRRRETAQRTVRTSTRFPWKIGMSTRDRFESHPMSAGDGVPETAVVGAPPPAGMR